MSDPTQVPPVDTGNPQLNGLITRGLLIGTSAGTAWVTAWLAAKGWYDPEFGWLITLAVFGALSSLALLAWSWVKNSRLAGLLADVQRQAVQAGINLTASGNAVTAGGAPIVAHGTGGGIETPRSVTTATAAEIVARFAVKPVTVAPLPPIRA